MEVKDIFGTIILDAYTVDEVKSMSSFIEEICSPLDNYGWSSAGIYCFWDYYTKEILYIDLARSSALSHKILSKQSRGRSTQRLCGAKKSRG